MWRGPSNLLPDRLKQQYPRRYRHVQRVRTAAHRDTYQRVHRLARFGEQARFLVAHPQAEGGRQVLLP